MSDHIEKGILERPYIDYFLQNDKFAYLCDAPLNLQVLSGMFLPSYTVRDEEMERWGDGERGQSVSC